MFQQPVNKKPTYGKLKELLATAKRGPLDGRSNLFCKEIDLTLKKFEKLLADKQTQVRYVDNSRDTIDEAFELTLKEFLKKRWDRIKSTDLAYTQDSQNPASILCIGVAKFLNKNQQYTEEEMRRMPHGFEDPYDITEASSVTFQLLMPTLVSRATKLFPAGKDIHLYKITEFVMSDNNTAFIPVNDCVQHYIESGVWENPAVDLGDGVLKQLSEAEKERVLTHTPVVKEYTKYRIKNLYDLLKVICYELGRASVNKLKGGLGSENASNVEHNVKAEAYVWLYRYLLPLSKQKGLGSNLKCDQRHDKYRGSNLIKIFQFIMKEQEFSEIENEDCIDCIGNRLLNLMEVSKDDDHSVRTGLKNLLDNKRVLCGTILHQKQNWDVNVEYATGLQSSTSCKGNAIVRELAYFGGKVKIEDLMMVVPPEGAVIKTMEEYDTSLLEVNERGRHGPCYGDVPNAELLRKVKVDFQADFPQEFPDEINFNNIVGLDDLYGRIVSWIGLNVDGLTTDAFPQLIKRLVTEGKLLKNTGANSCTLTGLINKLITANKLNFKQIICLVCNLIENGTLKSDDGNVESLIKGLINGTIKQIGLPWDGLCALIIELVSRTKLTPAQGALLIKELLKNKNKADGGSLSKQDISKCIIDNNALFSSIHLMGALFQKGIVFNLDEDLIQFKDCRELSPAMIMNELIRAYKLDASQLVSGIENELRTFAGNIATNNPPAREVLLGRIVELISNYAAFQAPDQNALPNQDPNAQNVQVLPNVARATFINTMIESGAYGLTANFQLSLIIKLFVAEKLKRDDALLLIAKLQDVYPTVNNEALINVIVETSGEHVNADLMYLLLFDRAKLNLDCELKSLIKGLFKKNQFVYVAAILKNLISHEKINKESFTALIKALLSDPQLNKLGSITIIAELVRGNGLVSPVANGGVQQAQNEALCDLIDELLFSKNFTAADVQKLLQSIGNHNGFVHNDFVKGLAQRAISRVAMENVTQGDINNNIRNVGSVIANSGMGDADVIAMFDELWQARNINKKSLFRLVLAVSKGKYLLQFLNKYLELQADRVGGKRKSTKIWQVIGWLFVAALVAVALVVMACIIAASVAWCVIAFGVTALGAVFSGTYAFVLPWVFLGIAIAATLAVVVPIILAICSLPVVVVVKYNIKEAFVKLYTAKDRKLVVLLHKIDKSKLGKIVLEQDGRNGKKLHLDVNSKEKLSGLFKDSFFGDGNEDVRAFQPQSSLFFCCEGENLKEINNREQFDGELSTENPLIVIDADKIEAELENVVNTAV